jgi:hypothetical protein
VSGCASRPTATFNRGAVYQVPPSGLWVDSVLYRSGPGEWTHTGRMWIPPGAMIGTMD